VGKTEEKNKGEKTGKTRRKQMRKTRAN